jgi:hypothetical protein
LVAVAVEVEVAGREQRERVDGCRSVGAVVVRCGDGGASTTGRRRGGASTTGRRRGGASTTGRRRGGRVAAAANAPRHERDRLLQVALRHRVRHGVAEHLVRRGLELEVVEPVARRAGREDDVARLVEALVGRGVGVRA